MRRGGTVTLGMPNVAGSRPESSIFGSIWIGGLAARPTFVGKTWIDKTSGAMLRAMKATLTSFRAADDEEFFKTARHWRYLVFGLATCPPLGSVSAVLHALHVSSGFSVFPVRVWTVTLPLERHQIRPQVAIVFASSTDES